MRFTPFAAAAAALAVAASTNAAVEVVAAEPIGDITYGDSATVVTADYNGLETVNAIGITGQWQFVSGDSKDGFFPWYLDTTIDITTPLGAQATYGPAIGGDVTIADYPAADASGPIITGSQGTWSFGFRNVPAAGGVSRLANLTLYFLTTVPDVTFNETVTPDANNVWDRPFFIAGVSGLGPTNYDVLEFTVDRSGLYEFESVLSTADDHFTFLYRDDFVPGLPLTNLLDYGLGNGNSPFNVPQGTSRISALLLAGETYFWVTSTWDRFTPPAPADNTIVGPGNVTPVIPCAGDADGNLVVDVNDITVVVNNLGTNNPDADVDGNGIVDVNDITEVVNNLGLICN